MFLQLIFYISICDGYFLLYSYALITMAGYVIECLTNDSYYLAHTNPLFLSMKVLPLRKIFFHRVGLVMYKYSNHRLPECIAQLYLRNDSIHEHNTRGSQVLRVPLGSKTISSLSARIWNALSLNLNCNISISLFKRNLKLLLLHNDK